VIEWSGPTTPCAPLKQGNVLVASEKPKREEGKETGKKRKDREKNVV
jgi:hypothetical protein